MENRIVISSDHRDLHGDVMTKEALESGAKIINGDKRVKWTIDHKRDIPPFGKITDAEVIEKDGHYYLVANELPYDMFEDLSWGDKLVKAYCSHDDKPFNEPEIEVPDQLVIDLDPNIFKSNNDYIKYQESLLHLNPEIKTREYFRKALINDPEIVLIVAKYIFIYKLLKPVINKTSEKIVSVIAKKASHEASIFYDLIRHSFKELLLRLKPSNRPISYIIWVPGNPEIELFARVKDPDHLIKALNSKKILNIKKEIDDFNRHIKIEKIQFTLSEKGKWKFNFLLTNKGEAIGTKQSFKKRDRKMEYVKELTIKKKLSTNRLV